MQAVYFAAVPASHVGELAALGTAACWALSAVFFANASRRVGSMVTNLVRLVLAFGLLTSLAWILRGHALPHDADARAWSVLALSGVVGMFFGDLCLFRAFVLVGARLSSLVMAAAPPMAAILGYLALDERLSPSAIAGIALTMGGIAWAVSERRDSTVTLTRRERNLGVLLALGGALGQAGGLVLSKIGLASYDPVAGTQIRVLAGIVCFAALFTAIGGWKDVAPALRDRTAMRGTALGALFGPCLGVSLSLLAVQRAPTGVAASIMATAPILVIPIARVFGGERTGPRGIVGALVAVLGVVLLFR
jgi:drug/metabolite transporter (DMT)-like permease